MSPLETKLDGSKNEYYSHAKLEGDLFQLSENAAKALKNYGVSKDDFDDIVEHMEKSALNGNTEAINKLASMYYDGVGFARNHPKAAYWYTIGSNYGNSWSKLKLADMYYNGHGVEQNFVKYAELIIESAEDGLYESIQKLIDLGIKDNRYVPKILDVLEKVAIRGSVDSMIKLAQMYEMGTLVEIDIEKSKMWYLKAASCGNLWAMGKYDALL